MKAYRNKRAVIVIILILAAILLAGCVSNETIEGNWQEPDSGVTLSIGKDGTVTWGYNGASFTLTYELQDPDVLIFKASSDGTIPEQKLTYILDAEKLTLTLDGVDTQFYRVDEK